jgi:signal transduction histidine kinase
MPLIPAASTEPVMRVGLVRRGTPFVAMMLLGFLLFAVNGPRDWWYFLAAAVLFAAACLLAALAPWSRLPSIVGVVPPIALLATVALLREGHGGTLSGFGALFLISILWVACYGTRGQLGILLIALAAAYWVPIVIVGAPEYPSFQWRAGGLFVIVAGLFGIVIQDLIESLRREQRRREDVERELGNAQAYELHDDVVQNLTVAQLSLSRDDRDGAASALGRALVGAQQVVSELLDRTNPDARPGTLVRGDHDPPA